MSCRKLGSMVRINGLEPTYTWGIPWGYNPLILTIDPKFQRDIQVASQNVWRPNMSKPIQIHPTGIFTYINTP